MTDTPTWEERATRLIEVTDQMASLAKQQQTLSRLFVEALADYQRLITENNLPIEVPCGFRPSDHWADRGADNGRIFWRLVRLDPVSRTVHFHHECGPDHYAGGGGTRRYEKDLVVPLMFFTHRREWLTLTALAGTPAV